MQAENPEDLVDDVPKIRSGAGSRRESEQRPDRHAEAGENVVADEYVGRIENGDLIAAAIDRHGRVFRIDDPNHAAAGGQPILNLGRHFARAIAGRKNFDRQVGRLGEETLARASAGTGRHG